MASLRDIRRHISSIKNIKQITYAMKMVAAARIKRAQKAILSSRPFAVKMEEAVFNLFSEMAEEDFRTSPAYRLFEKSGEKTGRTGLIVITADKGLCGSFNINILKTAVRWLKEHSDREVRIIAVGKKGRDFFKRLKSKNVNISYEMVGIFPKVSYAHSNILCEEILRLYGIVDEINLIYAEFKSMMKQKVEIRKILPIKSRRFEGRKKTGLDDFSFEPEKKILLAALLPRYIKAEFYRILLESQAAELAARMNAMENASKNAADIIEGLTLKLNKTRQAMITTELTEIVGGAEALKN